MAAKLHEQIKSEVKDVIQGALETIAKEKCPKGFCISDEDSERLFKVVKIKKVETESGCQTPFKGEKEAPRSLCLVHSHTIHLTAQADFKVRVYHPKPTKSGTNMDKELGAAGGAMGGAAGGVAVGAMIGSVIPGPGTLIGGALGGLVGGIGGLFAGGRAAAGGEEESTEPDVSTDKYEVIEVFEVFQKFGEFSTEKNQNSCYCVVTGNTPCPYREGVTGGGD